MPVPWIQVPSLHLPAPDFLYDLAARAGRVLLLLVGALVLVQIADRAIRGLRGRWLLRMIERTPHASAELEKRAATIGEMLRKSVTVVLWLAALMMALKEAGFDVRPLLAGAGIAGLAIGFGAQSLVRDIITGLFMLLENQIRMEDVVVINGTQGAVEELNLRTTVLRGADGAVHIFHNGAINTLSNLTREYSYYVVNVRVGYKTDPDRAFDALRQAAEELRADAGYAAAILAPLEVLGIDQFADGAMVVQARLKTAPARQWEVGRELNRRIKKKFDEAGIELR